MMGIRFAKLNSRDPDFNCRSVSTTNQGFYCRVCEVNLHALFLSLIGGHCSWCPYTAIKVQRKNATPRFYLF